MEIPADAQDGDFWTGYTDVEVGRIYVDHHGRIPLDGWVRGDAVEGTEDEDCLRYKKTDDYFYHDYSCDGQLRFVCVKNEGKVRLVYLVSIFALY